MNRMTGQQGLSLVEVTIMLLVLMLLTGVLAPSILDFVNDAKWVKVKEDCEAIGITIARMTRDVGPCLKFAGAGPCDEANRVDILHSDGPDTLTTDLEGAATTDFSNAGITPNSINWDNDSDAQVGDSMDNQFVINAPLYNTPMQNYPGSSYPAGPLFGTGWRGAYLAPPVGPDPWGKRYLVNSAFLAMASDSAAATSGPTGLARMVSVVVPVNEDRWWEQDVFCLSPGPNGLYETYFGGCPSGQGTCRQGDDFVYVVAGSGR